MRTTNCGGGQTVYSYISLCGSARPIFEPNGRKRISIAALSQRGCNTCPVTTILV